MAVIYISAHEALVKLNPRWTSISVRCEASGKSRADAKTSEIIRAIQQRPAVFRGCCKRNGELKFVQCSQEISDRELMKLLGRTKRFFGHGSIVAEDCSTVFRELPQTYSIRFDRAFAYAPSARIAAS